MSDEEYQAMIENKIMQEDTEENLGFLNVGFTGRRRGDFLETLITDKNNVAHTLWISLDNKIALFFK